MYFITSTETSHVKYCPTEKGCKILTYEFKMINFVFDNSGTKYSSTCPKMGMRSISQEITTFCGSMHPRNAFRRETSSPIPSYGFLSLNLDEDKHSRGRPKTTLKIELGLSILLSVSF